MQAYVSGPLTGVEPDPRPIYEFAAEALERRGVTAYLPHRATDPRLHPHVSAGEVYARDRLHVLSADFVVAFMVPPSLGVGIELELAAAGLLPVIALQPKGSVVSRMARGVPTRIYGPHPYESNADVERILNEGLSFMAGQPAAPRLPAIGERVRTLRESARLSRAQLAELIGTSTERVAEVEEATPRVSNPTLALLTAVAQALGQDTGALLPMSGTLGWDLDGLVPPAHRAAEEQLTLPFATEVSSEVAEVEG